MLSEKKKRRYVRTIILQGDLPQLTLHPNTYCHSFAVYLNAFKYTLSVVQMPDHLGFRYFWHLNYERAVLASELGAGMGVSQM